VGDFWWPPPPRLGGYASTVPFNTPCSSEGHDVEPHPDGVGVRIDRLGDPCEAEGEKHPGDVMLGIASADDDHYAFIFYVVAITPLRPARVKNELS
jgi:hypothetical protein